MSETFHLLINIALMSLQEAARLSPEAVFINQQQIMADLHMTLDSQNTIISDVEDLVSIDVVPVLQEETM